MYYAALFWAWIMSTNGVLLGVGIARHDPIIMALSFFGMTAGYWGLLEFVIKPLVTKRGS